MPLNANQLRSILDNALDRLQAAATGGRFDPEETLDFVESVQNFLCSEEDLDQPDPE